MSGIVATIEITIPKYTSAEILLSAGLRQKDLAFGHQCLRLTRPAIHPSSPLITNMPKDPLLKGLGDVLGEIPLDSFQPRDDGLAAKKVDITTLTSYNLLPKQRKTIIVPGG